MAEKAKISFDEVFRVRFGLIHRDIEQITNLAHIDDFRKHKVALLYLNDTDGNTKIYNQKHNFDEPNSTIYSDEDFTIKTEVEPKANRVVFFDGSYYHSSMTPTKTQLRYTINFNFI